MPWKWTCFLRVVLTVAVTDGSKLMRFGCLGRKVVLSTIWDVNLVSALLFFWKCSCLLGLRWQATDGSEPFRFGGLGVQAWRLGKSRFSLWLVVWSSGWFVINIPCGILASLVYRLLNHYLITFNQHLTDKSLHNHIYIWVIMFGYCNSLFGAQ